MSAFDQAVARARTRHPRAVIAGVCAETADRLALPVWLLRVPLIIALVHSTCTTAVVYALAAVALRTRLADALPPRQEIVVRRDRPRARADMGDGDRRSDPGYSMARERFTGLEARLARMEAAVTSDELKLRARFRDLEG